MAGLADVTGDPGTWEAARELGKKLIIPVGPYEPRVPTADEMNAVLPYILDRTARFARDKYFCENAEITLAHVLGINTPRQGFPDSSGFCYRTNRDWEGYDTAGFNVNGFNREGFNRDGFDRDGFNKDGYNCYGRDKEGFDKNGRNQGGHTREEAVQHLVAGWSEQFAAVISAHVVQLKAAEDAIAGQAAAPGKGAKAPAKKRATAKKDAPTPKRAPRKAAPRPVLVAAG